MNDAISNPLKGSRHFSLHDRADGSGGTRCVWPRHVQAQGDGGFADGNNKQKGRRHRQAGGLIRASGRCGLLGIALVVMLALTAPMSASANDTAKAVIEGFYQRLLEVMNKGPELGFEGRRAVLAPVLDETFDLPFLAKLVLGRARKDLSPEQIDEFTRVFTAMVVATYASRFDNYEQERFAATGERGLRGRVLVETQVEGTSMGTVRSTI